MSRQDRTGPPWKKIIFRPWITKNGKKIYASWYGLKAFPIEVDDDE